MRRLLVMFMSFVSVGAYAAVHTEPAGDGGHVTVPAWVNGKGPYPFILDTGAEGSDVYAWLANQLHLPSAGSESLNGMTGSTQVARYRVESLTMDGHTLHDVALDELPNRKDNGVQAGVLGLDFMSDAVAVFDFACHRMEVHPRTGDLMEVVAKAGAAIHAEHAGQTDLLQIPVRINGAWGVAVLDTGNRVSKINSIFAHLARVDPSAASFHDEAPIEGANLKAMIPRAGPIGRVEFGSIQLDDVHAQVIDLPVMADMDAGKPVLWLGSDLLQTVHFVYDHAGQQVWFRASDCAVNTH
jgi:predicted aspartyl protease